jgi:hypothetical protein
MSELLLVLGLPSHLFPFLSKTVCLKARVAALCLTAPWLILEGCAGPSRWHGEMF